MPHRADATGATWTTSVGVHRMGLTVDLERLVLRRSHDITDRDSFGSPGEVIPSLGPPNALNQAGTAQPQQNLFDIVRRQALGIGELACGDGTASFASPFGKMNRDDETVFGPGGNPHARNMERRRAGINVEGAGGCQD